MSKIVLYHCPGACSRVTMNALEEAGVDYEDRAVDLFAGGHKKPEYLAFNPKGKVPALTIDGRLMTENAAIVAFLARQYPRAHLLPRYDDPIEDQQSLIDLVWCSGTLHPMVRQIRAPMRFTAGDTSGVVADGTEKFTRECELFARRFADGRWWYGSQWSIVDVYIYWCYTAASAGFPIEKYAAIIAHAARVTARPSFERARQRELAAVERDGVKLPPGAKL